MGEAGHAGDRDAGAPEGANGYVDVARPHRDGGHPVAGGQVAPGAYVVLGEVRREHGMVDDAR